MKGRIKIKFGRRGDIFSIDAVIKIGGTTLRPGISAFIPEEEEKQFLLDYLSELKRQIRTHE